MKYEDTREDVKEWGMVTCIQIWRQYFHVQEQEGETWSWTPPLCQLVGTGCCVRAVLWGLLAAGGEPVLEVHNMGMHSFKAQYVLHTSDESSLSYGLG